MDVDSSGGAAETNALQGGHKASNSIVCSAHIRARVTEMTLPLPRTDEGARRFAAS